jgi:O-antigen/teichoic acid export membrane protein
MATELGALAKHTGVYGVGTLVGGIARAALVPIIARYLPAEEYGKASVVLVMVALLSIASELGLSSSLIKFVNEAKSDEERKSIVATILAGSLAVAVPLALVCGLLSGHLSRLLLGTPQYGSLVVVGVLGGFGNALLQIGLAFERAFARSVRYSLYTLAKGALSLALSILLVVWLDRGAQGLIIGAALPPLAIGCVIYARLFGRFGVRFSRSSFRAVFEFGGPLVPMNLSMWVLTYSDIYLLRRLVAAPDALSEVGLYQYAQEICLVLVLPITALNLAWPQFLFSNHSRPKGRDLFARAHSYFSFFLIAIGFLLSLFAREVIGVVGSAGYAGSAQVVPLLAGSLVFYGLAVVYSSGLYVSARTRILALIVGVCAVLNVVLNVLLIPDMGRQGAALATLVTNLVMMAVVLASAQASFRIPFRVGRTLAAVLLGGMVLVGLEALPASLGSTATVVLRLAAACGFLAGLFGLLGMGLQDLRRAVAVLRSVAGAQGSAQGG